MTIFKLAQSTEEAYKSGLRALLRGMNTSTPDIEASAVISGDGLLIASVLGPETDPDRYAAMCASLLALAERAALEIARGDLRLVLVEHMDEVLREALVLAEPETFLGEVPRSMEYRDGQLHLPPAPSEPVPAGQLPQ